MKAIIASAVKTKKSRLCGGIGGYVRVDVGSRNLYAVYRSRDYVHKKIRLLISAISQALTQSRRQLLADQQAGSN
ncbi:hypothetical protein [uncultured Ferrimonas sp.]|uniref:hypothetical protein n=1 Tax=uncultured Ferrimonas sp. TaxID=432640 RepID=UPI00260BDD06|nr:hypothetical protein [uncultured Ferrimonas sp.]